MPAYQDDLTIPNDGELLRRIHPNQIVQDDNLGGRRPSSAAFDDSQMSVYIGETVKQTNRNYIDVLAPFPEHSLVKFTAGFARQQNQGIAREPEPEEAAHGVVFGNKPRKVRRAFAKAVEWVRLRPPG